ncbi:MAG: glycosyltransferase family 9 protein [Saprospiraceae bacterium]
MPTSPKILIIRFSSIGDIILTTPVIRCVHQQLNAEIHVLTKNAFKGLFEYNPHVAKIHVLESMDRRVLKRMDFDHIIDLQKNWISRWLCFILGRPYTSFNKLNIKKWLLVHFKINLLPKKHLVGRYFEALKPLGINNDDLGCDYYIKEVNISENIQEMAKTEYDIIVLGAAHATKRISLQKCREIIGLQHRNIILLGGKDVTDMAALLKKECPMVINRVGKDNLDESAHLIRNARLIYTGDTGMMHLAVALQKRVVVLWGNTVPAFGMYPYYGNKQKNLSHSIEHKNLKCRPCSKLGYPSCPKGHFKCMEELEIKEILDYEQL